MKLSHFFIDRPVFAGVIAVLITLLGLIAYPQLPISQFPEIAPPTVTISATYPGATAETLAEAVATPIEQQVNGVEDMLYMSSQATGDGRLQITATFKLGTDLDKAQVLVQNRVATAEPRLPEPVRAQGVIVRKATPDFLIAVHLWSPDGSRDTQYMSNYLTLNIRDRILRLNGVGDVIIRGQRDYSMRIWIDPDKAAARNLTAEEITSALQRNNVQVAAGTLNQPPFGPGGGGYQLNVQTLGRLTTPEQFGQIIVKQDEQGRVTRVRDIARVELGAQDYTSTALLDGKPAVLLGVLQLPGTNAIATGKAVREVMKEMEATLPSGVAYRIVFDPTRYINDTVTEVQHTLLIGLILVVTVVIVFLQSWRVALIPILAIPVSLIGTLATMQLFGFSLNNLSMFGLVLAVGIVVDDAIVVVENVERHLRRGLTPRDAAKVTMDEVSGALVAIALVLVGVFLPAAAVPGITGQFYRQFALTIASATVLSLIVSLTLSPALAALILKSHDHEAEPRGFLAPLARLGHGFNHFMDRLGAGYGSLTRRLVRVVTLVLVVYAGFLALTAWRVTATPTGFIPEQDQGILYLALQLPTGSSLDRNIQISQKAIAAISDSPGLLATATNISVDPTTGTASPSATQLIAVLKSFPEREKLGLTLPDIIADLQKRVSSVDGANVRVIMPPSVRGIGTAGGFKMIIEDRNKQGYAALEQAAAAVAAEANKSGIVQNAFGSFNTKTPRLYADIDRDKAEILGVPAQRVFNALQTYLGSSYINDFNYLGYTYQVRAQADFAHRRDESDLTSLKTRSDTGAMVPLGSLVNLKRTTGPYRVLRYNLFPGAEVQGAPAPGYSTGQALKEMERAAAAALPAGFGYEWTELAYQQQTAGGTGGVVFALAVVFAFLLLAALYESVTLPLAVILIVPMCILAALTGVNIKGGDNNILTQVGLIVLIGLAAKNAILIVEFARQAEMERGLERHEAAVDAAQTRLRPILMTSIAFILGVSPLAFAHGAGWEMRQALGVAVFAGMIGVTVFGLMFTPSFYVVFRYLADRLPKPPKRLPAVPTTAAVAGPTPAHDLEAAE